MTTLYSILLTLDGLIYNVIDSLYDIFVAIATIDVFSTEQETINKIVTNVYVILGVVMLFALAYSLLRAVINPESFSKGDASFAKLVQNIVISIVIITILPTCFNFAYKFQTSILENDTIPNLLFGDSIDNPFTLEDNADNPNPSPGRTLAYSLFSSFLYVDFDVCASDLGTSVESLTAEQVKSCSEDIMIGATGGAKYVPFVNTAIGWLTNLLGDSSTSSFYYYDTMVKYGKYDFGVYSNFSSSASSGKLSYTWFFSTVVGIYVVIVLLNFVFDVALRFVKLLFLEIIAPIPVICKIIPGGKMKDVFSNWLKKVISVYLEVFIRVFTIVIGVYLILLVNDMDLVYGTTLQGLGFFQRVFARVVIIMGIITFIRQAPKLICDLFHIDSSGMKLGLAGLAERVAAGGGFVAASAVGGTGLGAIRNYKRSRRDGKGVMSSLGSAATGGVSAGVGSAWNSRKSKSFTDLKNVTSKGLAAQMAGRDKIEGYIRKRSSDKGGVPGAVWNDFTDWLTGKGVEDLDRIITASGDINKANDSFRSAAKKQWDKHSTDGAIVYDAGTDIANNFFKGAGSNRMFELYNSYRDANGKMRSASFIKSSIEQRKSEMQNRDLDFYVKQEVDKVGAMPIEANFTTNTFGPNGEKIVDKTAYYDALKKYNESVAAAKQRAQHNYNTDIDDLTYLETMYTQLEKKSITELGRAALEGRDVGTVTAADLFETKEYGEAAQRVIRDSGLDKFDPAKNVKVEVKNGDFATFIDDMASAASKQAGHAAREKQNYLDKKKKQ